MRIKGIKDNNGSLNKVNEYLIKIDWADLDLFGHVNNVAFFKYIQSARINFCETIGLTSTNEKDKLGFMVASSKCQFKKPLLYPNTITLKLKLDWMKNTSIQLSYQIINGQQELIAEAEDVLVVFDYQNKTKTVIPDGLRAEISKIGA